MASCSIENTLSGKLFPELLSKLRSHETCFPAESSVDEFDKYVRDLKYANIINAVIFSSNRVKKLLALNQEKINKTLVTTLEVHSFIFKIWLRRIQITRQEGKEKNNSIQDFENAIYNAQEVIKDYKDFIYKQAYNEEELQQMLPYYEERLEKALSKTLEEKEKASFEMSEEDVARFCSNSARICALLGLQLDFLDRLKNVSSEGRDHLTLCEWIVTILANNYEFVSVTDKQSPLVSIGFDPLSSAVETIMERAESTQQHIEACEMAELFIEDEFKYNILLSPLPVRFPFKSNLTNTRFQLSTNENENICHVNIINLVIKESQASQSVIEISWSTFNDLVSEDERNTVLFHGTDHVSASDILSRRIDLRRGRQKRDFSSGSGFYLTNNFDDALNWANSTTAKPAMLIFQVNRHEYLDDARKLNLTENENEVRWREIVSLFRSDKMTAKKQRSLRAHDFIEGPVATVTTSETSPDELVIEPKPSSYQICLTSQDFADKFRQTLHSIIFLDIC